LVESVGGLVGGAFIGVGASILLMATPVGWVAALAIGVTGALAGYGGGKIAKGLYDATGRKIDFSGNLGVSTLCAPSGTEKMKSTIPKLSEAALSAL
jgi:hypothetical protein